MVELILSTFLMNLRLTTGGFILQFSSTLGIVYYTAYVAMKMSQFFRKKVFADLY